MIILGIILYLILGYITLCLTERFLKFEAPTIIVIISYLFAPLALLTTLIGFIAQKTDTIKTSPSKLRKWIRGF